MATSIETLRRSILGLVASGRAQSRAELSRMVGVPASTVSLAVQGLLDRGLLEEVGTVASRGGRPQKRLVAARHTQYVLVADLGGAHVRLGALGVARGDDDVEEVPFDIRLGPEHAVEVLGVAFRRLIERNGRDGLAGVGLALPGPVDIERGCVDSPSRMPGWHGFPIRERLAQEYGVPVVVDNDANLMALAEYTARPEHAKSITVKAGTAIGGGFVIDGEIYHGAGVIAGDITHVRIAAAGDMPCSCGNVGCLETVASGAALVRVLRAAGIDVESTADVVLRARSGEPEVTSAVRGAGRHLGEVLAGIVNFLNPDAVYIGGALSAVEPFVAAVRSRLYESCHPLVTRDLAIERAAFGPDATAIGAGYLALQAALAPGAAAAAAAAAT